MVMRADSVDGSEAPRPTGRFASTGGERARRRDRGAQAHDPGLRCSYLSSLPLVRHSCHRAVSAQLGRRLSRVLRAGRRFGGSRNDRSRSRRRRLVPAGRAAMPMERLPNRRPTPLARIGRHAVVKSRRCAHSRAGKSCSPSRRNLAGGAHAPSVPGVHWLAGAGVSGPAEPSPAGSRSLRRPLASSTVTRSVTDLVAACNGTVSSARRATTGQSSYLIAWAERNRRIDRRWT